MKKKNILSIIILVSFAILGTIFLKGRTHELVRLLEIDFRYILIIILFIILSSLFRGHKLKMLMELYGIKLKFKEWYGLQIITQFGNYLTPFKGGSSAQAIYFKKEYKFPYTFYASTTGIGCIIDFIVFGLSGVFFSLFISVQSNVRYSLLVFFTIVILGSIFILFFLPPLPLSPNTRILRPITKSVNELQRIRKEYLLIFKLSLNCVGRVLTTTTQTYFIFLALKSVIPFYLAGMIVIFTALSTVISITPMNLGFRESVVIISAKLFGIGTVLGALVAVIDRVLTMVCIVISAPIWGYIISKDFKMGKKHLSE